MNVLRDKIVLIRREARLTQKEFGRKIGVHQSQISMWELGVFAPSNIALKKIIEIGKKYSIEITIDDILSTRENQNKNH